MNGGKENGIAKLIERAVPDGTEPAEQEKTAANAGLSFIGVSWGFRERSFLEKNGAVKIADDPKELLKIVYKF